MVADCLPVLFTTRDGSRIAAAHAGWRGLAAGVLERTVESMKVPLRAPGRESRELRAWLGPCISRDHFEVGDEVREEFVRQDAGAGELFQRNSRNRWLADLVGLARLRLRALGIEDICGGGWCTFADPERFYSHRRDGKGGRLAALIWRG
jgi:YfiH family protein